MSTESQLWRTLARTALPPGLQMTRIETGDTACGVSDIAYVGPHSSGWVELKILDTQRASSLFSFTGQYTVEQFRWLVAHYKPDLFLYSWLLVGKPGAGGRGWEQFILLPAPVTVRLLKAPSCFLTGQVLNWPQAVVVADARAVVQHLARAGKQDKSK